MLLDFNSNIYVTYKFIEIFKRSLLIKRRERERERERDKKRENKYIHYLYHNICIFYKYLHLLGTDHAVTLGK